MVLAKTEPNGQHHADGVLQKMATLGIRSDTAGMTDSARSATE